MLARAAVLAAAFLIWTSPVRAAEANDPIVGYGGGYHEHPATWSGAWIAQNFQRCCGEEDCAQVPMGGVMHNPDGSYTVLETGEIFGSNDPQIESSEDGSFWRCKYNTGHLQGQTRCLFVPPLGF